MSMYKNLKTETFSLAGKIIRGITGSANSGISKDEILATQKYVDDTSSGGSTVNGDPLSTRDGTTDVQVGIYPKFKEVSINNGSLSIDPTQRNCFYVEASGNFQLNNIISGKKPDAGMTLIEVKNMISGVGITFDTDYVSVKGTFNSDNNKSNVIYLTFLKDGKVAVRIDPVD